MDEKTALGCIGGVLVLVTIPMWLALLFVILDSICAPVWAWGIFFAYIPATITAGVIHVAANSIDQ